MTSALVRALRDLADEHQHPLVGWERRLVKTLSQAADALELREAEVQRLRVVLVDIKYNAHAWDRDSIAERARKALAEGGGT